MFQVAFPLRHFFIVDDANWTEEGQRFAWRMMLRMKAPGHIVYYVRDDQLMVQSENRVEVDWERWPNEKKNEIYVPILSSHFSWEQHPGLTMIFEPCLGQRIIFGVEGDLELAKQTIRDKWQSTYGRVPTIETTIDLDTAIRQMRQSVAIENTVVRDLLDELERLTVDGPPQPIALTESRRQLDLTDTIERLLRSGEPSAERLRAVHPFEIQGAVRPNRTLLAIRDPLLENADGTGETHRLTDGSAFVVWLDLEKMRPRDWRRLPQQFVVFERGGLNIIWNHFKQLNWQQTERMANRPHMIWQYARHIADCWESSTGRRPEVRADTQVILNYRAPRPIVDPTSDLSRVEYRLLGHNEWITKIEGELPSWNRMRAAAKQTDSNIR